MDLTIFMGCHLLLWMALKGMILSSPMKISIRYVNMQGGLPILQGCIRSLTIDLHYSTYVNISRLLLFMLLISTKTSESLKMASICKRNQTLR